MLEAGAVVAGSTVGGAAGKKVSDGIGTSLKKTGKALDTANKTGDKKGKEPAAVPGGSTPILKVSAGVPKTESNNVPPPPPPVKRAVAAPKPVRSQAVSVPMVMSSVIPRDEPAFLVNVDLTGVAKGMERSSLLALGMPSARITMYEDGHLLEIYQYRNQTFSSGTVRLRDGSVSAVETR